jgi:hypothetical protein
MPPPGDETDQLITHNSGLVDFDLRQVDGVNSEFWSAWSTRRSNETRADDGVEVMNERLHNKFGGRH